MHVRALGIPIVVAGLVASIGAAPALPHQVHIERALSPATELQSPASDTPTVENTGGVSAAIDEVTVGTSIAEIPGDDAVPEPLAEALGDELTPTDVLSALASVSGLAVVGVTWEQGTAGAGTTVALRTRLGDVWGEWSPVDLEIADTGDSETGPDGATGTGLDVRDGTSPVFVGAVDEVQVAVSGPDGQQPRDVRLVLIDPGDDGIAQQSDPSVERVESASRMADREPVAAAMPAQATPAATAVAMPARPTIHSRAQWGADESLMTWTPKLGRVSGAVIHHTAGTNGYTADQVPSIIRGIYSYHAVSRGWGDIGYNFLVDRFGQIWEGRSGGVEKAIIGGHAIGVNSETTGISLMGNYDSVTVPAAAMTAIENLVAWKLSLHGVGANTTTTIAGVSRPSVMGHRDVASTACPGANLYPRLTEIRTRAAALQGSGAFRSTSRNLIGSAQPELVVQQSNGSVGLLTNEGWTWSAPAVQATGLEGGTLLDAGDQNGDGRGDLFWRDPKGLLFLITRTAEGLADPVQVGKGWQHLNAIVSGYDWTGDGFPDVLGRRADGTLWLYAGSAGGHLATAVQVGRGWGVMSALTMVPAADGRAAILARDTTGRLWTYPGDGNGGFRTPIAMGRGWNAMTAILAAGDNTGDGVPDVLARDTEGRLWSYAGRGDGTIGGSTQVGKGFSFPTITATTNGKSTEVFWATVAGTVKQLTFAESTAMRKFVATGVSVASSSDVIFAGDWDGDGSPDLMVRDEQGILRLHRGTGAGKFASTGQQIGTGWSGFQDVVAAPNFAGDGKPALIALERSSSRIWLYPGSGSGGFTQRVQIGTAGLGADELVLPGPWGGRVPDVITRENGNLIRRSGNGAGLLGDPVQIGRGWASAADIVGVGDANGDGHADIVLVGKDGAVHLYPGNGSGGFLTARVIGQAPAGSPVS